MSGSYDIIILQEFFVRNINSNVEEYELRANYLDTMVISVCFIPTQSNQVEEAAI
jgi:hypothetical protein